MLRVRARQQLWRLVFINREKLEGFLNRLRDPRFASTNALSICRLQISHVIQLSRENLRTIFTSLPNLERFGHWGLSEYFGEDLIAPPSLQHVSCDPLIFAADPDQMDFDSPFFQNITHLHLWDWDYLDGDNDRNCDTWNMASLKVLVRLTHLRMNLSCLREHTKHMSYVENCIIPSLPPSIQIVIMDVESDLLTYEFCSKLRKGEVDRRVLLYVDDEPCSLEWIIEGGELDRGEEGGRRWLNGGEDSMWESGVEMLNRRNNTLDFQSSR
ncbi:hypothetical protein DL96DRAFT_1766424 [Flagelloscypha sp. PMI_526]|nr:hypothetical protein DL96DRAFT_1766424 [Flagelloscypha sp. PMI_526]